MKSVILGTDENRNLEILKGVSWAADLLISRGNQELFFSADDIQHYDILHSGGSMLNDKSFQLLKYVSLNWHYLDPLPQFTSNTWKCGSDCVWISRQAIAKVGGFDFRFRTADSVLAEFAYRVLRQGGRVKYIPGLVKSGGQQANVSLVDELNFMHKYLGYKYAVLGAFAAIPAFGLLKIIRAFRKFRQRQTKFTQQIINLHSYKTEAANKRLAVKYTAIIPTILRYPYLQKSINSLLSNEFPPEEIIIVDQTPLSQRDREFYRQFPVSRVKVFFLDRPGQSTARNLAIREAKHELILLFEDDGEAWPDMVKEHLKLLADKTVDVSTGVALAPGKTRNDIPEAIRGYHTTDVLATGNAMVRKASVLRVNGLDVAFDHGSGADDDLGKRMYLQGAEIVFNPDAIMTHYKAPMGGMRVHGAWWRNKTSLFAEYPPATQLHSIKKFYAHTYWRSLIFIQYLKAAKRNSWLQQVLLTLLFPYKLWLAGKKASRLAQA